MWLNASEWGENHTQVKEAGGAELASLSAWPSAVSQVIGCVQLFNVLHYLRWN